MDYLFHKSKNGLETGFVSLPGHKTVTVLLCLRVGSKHDARTKRGTAHFIEHMLFKGTKNRPLLTQLEREIERLGGFFNAFTVKEFTWFYIKLLNKDLEKAVDVLHDVLLNSLFLPTEVEKEKQIILEEINRYNDSPPDMIEDIFEKGIYGDQPIAWPSYGDPTTIKKLKYEDLLTFFKKFYVATNATIVVAGDINTKSTSKLIDKYFSDFPTGKPIKDVKTVLTKNVARKIIIKNEKLSQSQIALGVRAFQIDHKNHYVTKLIAILLGGSMSARLFKRLREELGLVYDVYTMSESRKNDGYLVSYTGADKKNVRKTVKEIIKEYEKFKYQEVEAQELEDAKSFLLNKKKILFESSDFIALDLAKRIIFKKKAMTTKDYQKEINKVTSQDIMRVANEIFVNENLCLAIIGDVTKRDREVFRELLKFKK